MNKRLIWFKDNIVRIEEAKINILAPTSQFGINVFEGIRGYWNEKNKELYIFKLDEHIYRLLESAKLIEFKLKYNFKDLKKAIIDTIKANGFKKDIAIRQTLFVDGNGSWSSSEPIEMFIAPIVKKRAFKNGISCCISSWKRINENSISPRIKMGSNYVNSRMAQLEANRNGYDSAIFLNDRGTISEGPGSCIFIIKNGILITPNLTASILESITRETIIEIVKNELNLEIQEREINRTELYTADEAFLCGTTIEITPIYEIDRYKIGNGKMGEITNKIRNLYFDIVIGKKLKYKKWLTPIYNNTIGN